MQLHAENFQLDNYCRRIGYTGPTRADLSTVTALMRHQLESVPFENLDVRAGKGISLVPEDIVDKIIRRRRGGYCYEVNGLFAMALTALGATYRFVGCRPMTYPARRPRTHMALLVNLAGEEWLCDAGFGSYGMRSPMRLRDTGEIRQGHDSFLLSSEDGREFVFKARVEGEWANQYCFDLSHHEWVDFMPANWLNSTHPETLFTRHLLVLRQTPEGRVMLFDDCLKTVNQGRVEVKEVTAEQLPDLLREVFGLAESG